MTDDDPDAAGRARLVLRHDAHHIAFTAPEGASTVEARRSADDTLLARIPAAGALFEVEAVRDVAEAWIAAQLGATPPSPVPCRACGGLIEVGGCGNPDRALRVTFDGGYGMFIDPVTSPEVSVTLCGRCAQQLCDAHDWVAETLERAR